MIELGVSRFAPERRAASSYSSLRIDELEASAIGGGGPALATAATEIGASWWSTGFALADVENGGPIGSTLDAACLSHVGRELARRGESVHLIDVDALGRSRLLPIWDWDVYGDADPDSWIYRVNLSGPTRSTSRTVPAASVVHVRYSFESSRPWIGVSPVQWAAASGRLAGGLDRQFGDEAMSPSGYMCSVPDLALPGVDDANPEEGAGDTDELGKLRADLQRAGGRTVLTPAGGWDVINGKIRGGDYESRRFGLRPGQAEVLLRADAQKWATLIFGIPPGIFDQNAASGGTRDGWRLLVNLRIASLGRLVEQELRIKLDAPDLALDFRRARSSDLMTLARAIGSLVKQGGMTLDDARAIVGL